MPLHYSASVRRDTIGMYYVGTQVAVVPMTLTSWWEVMQKNAYQSSSNTIRIGQHFILPIIFWLTAHLRQKFPLCDCGDENDLLGPSFSRQGPNGDRWRVCIDHIR